MVGYPGRSLRIDFAVQFQTWRFGAFFFSCWIIVAFKARDYFLITDTFFHFFGLGNYDI